MYVDSIVSELLDNEIHLKSQYKREILSTPNPSVLAVPSKSSSNYHNMISTRVTFHECNFYK